MALWLALVIGLLAGWVIVAVIVGAYLSRLGRSYRAAAEQEEAQGSPGREPGRR